MISDGTSNRCRPSGDVALSRPRAVLTALHSTSSASVAARSTEEIQAQRPLPSPPPSDRTRSKAYFRTDSGIARAVDGV